MGSQLWISVRDCALGLKQFCNFFPNFQVNFIILLLSEARLWAIIDDSVNVRSQNRSDVRATFIRLNMSFPPSALWHRGIAVREQTAGNKQYVAKNFPNLYQ